MKATPKPLWSLALISVLIGLFLWTNLSFLLYFALAFGVGALFFPSHIAWLLAPLITLLQGVIWTIRFLCSGLFYFLVLTPVSFLQRLLKRPSLASGMDNQDASFFSIPEKKDWVERFRKMY